MEDILDFLKTPAGQGLLSGAFGYAANAKKGTPWNNFGRGGMTGLLGYNTAIDQQQQQEGIDLAKSYKTMQMDQIKADMDAKQQQQKVMQDLAERIGGLLAPKTQEQVVGYQFNPSSDASNVRFDMSSPNAQSDYLKVASALQAKAQSGKQLTPDEEMVLNQVKSRLSPVKQQVQTANPNIGNVLRDNGVSVGLQYPALGEFLLKASDRFAPDYVQVDTGNGVQFINKRGEVPGFIPKNMSPEAIASNQLGWANNAVSQQQANTAAYNASKPTYHDGALVGPDGSIVKTPMYSPPKNSPEANAQSSKKILPLLEQADKLLNEATGSYVGTARDTAAGAVGYSTKGAQASAQLKALEGAIMLNQPRMEGPQSDRDTALYRQMAGQIGDSTVPVETRRAALEGIRRLHEQYAGQNPNKKSTISPGGWSATIVE